MAEALGTGLLVCTVVGSGIMADNVIAGLYTFLILQSARLLIDRFQLFTG